MAAKVVASNARLGLLFTSSSFSSLFAVGILFDVISTVTLHFLWEKSWKILKFSTFHASTSFLVQLPVIFVA